MAEKIYVQDAKPFVWMNFEQDLLARFGPTDYEDFDEALSHIEQKGTVWEYQWEFERLANRVEGWPQKALEDQMNRAKPFFRGEKITLYTKKPIGGRIINPNYQTQSNNTTSQEDFVGGNAEAEGKGLCFSCNERFMPGHRCAIKQLFVFDAENGGEYDSMADKLAMEQTE
ncbi:hypothetical protein Pint_04288 [Pistacia integerrima]|uniref:Uncharacterized protein n=1 Tax=Pistacia integerrima TaxID=434235 RepID=A0ACC0Z5M2_9ROSI|nr:hypothetical protein Pint_04288 [Pistacia integerrima]